MESEFLISHQLHSSISYFSPKRIVLYTNTSKYSPHEESYSTKMIIWLISQKLYMIALLKMPLFICIFLNISMHMSIDPTSDIHFLIMDFSQSM